MQVVGQPADAEDAEKEKEVSGSAHELGATSGTKCREQTTTLQGIAAKLFVAYLCDVMRLRTA